MIRLSDSEWERIRRHFPEENIRKPVPTRKILEAALWILNTGAQWHMLPQCYPNYKTVHRRFQAWCHSEVLRRVLPTSPTSFARVACWTKKRASSTQPSRWRRAEVRTSVRRSEEKA